MRRVPPLVAFTVLAGCALPAQVDVRDRMVGMSETQLASCMGPPMRKEDAGRSETWTYYAPDAINARPLDASMIPLHHQAVADMGQNACQVTVKLEAEKVMAVDYINMSSTREDDGCANAILRCSR
jgi:hypothetical protein